MTTTYPNESFRNYFYGQQVEQALLQTMAVFSGIQVSVGKSDLNPEGGLIYVPIRYGATDKIVEWILGSQTTNKPIRVPALAVKIISSELAPELRKGMRVTTSYTHLPRGGVLPDDAKVIRQMQPNPVKLGIELAAYVTNNKNRFEIYEQIHMMFDPDIIISTSDDVGDHYKISKLEFTSCSFDDEYPLGDGQELMVDTYNFTVDLRIGTPIDLKENIVKAVRLRLDAVSNLSAEEAVVELNNIGNSGDILFDLDDENMPEN